jgi:hypothetical protein
MEDDVEAQASVTGAELATHEEVTSWLRQHGADGGMGVAATILTNAAEGHDFLMHARIGMLRALNRHVERVFNSDHKETHWGKRKLKRDL